MHKIELLSVFVLMLWVHSEAKPIKDFPLSLYELIFKAESDTEKSGSVTLTCRDGRTADELNISDITFWLNSSSESGMDLSQREDINITEVGCCSIKFSLLRNLEGYYTCGTLDEWDNITDSQPLTLICLPVCRCYHAHCHAADPKKVVFHSTSNHHSTIS